MEKHTVSVVASSSSHRRKREEFTETSKCALSSDVKGDEDDKEATTKKQRNVLDASADATVKNYDFQVNELKKLFTSEGDTCV